MAVILKDVANKLNVSISTVSKAINNRPGISDELRSRILQTIEEMGYQSSVRVERTFFPAGGNTAPTINLSIRTNDSYLTESFYTLISQEITRQLQEHQYNILFNVISKSDLSPDEFTSIFESNNSNAFIIIGADIDQRLFEEIKQTGVTTVLVDNDFDGFSSVNTDNVQGAQSAVEYLAGLGHRDILCLAGPLHHKSIQGRYQGYLRAIQAQRLPGKPRLIECPGVSINDGLEAIASLKEIDFTAVFGCTDKLAIGAMKGLQKRGIKVPEQVSVMGFDDIEWGLHTEPELTTVKTAKRQIARMATKVVLDLLENQESYRMEVVIGTEILVRGSTGEVDGAGRTP
ncbi:MAG: LacI family transcriptional regulator [Chloroflexi bacterium]|nr:LacI family DNA-binding transcriptional regulator [Anaerolineaceae bacterium]NMB88994.1 LacI family transcriptional regulator [Chloroflexota bacterium]